MDAEERAKRREATALEETSSIDTKSMVEAREEALGGSEAGAGKAVARPGEAPELSVLRSLMGM